MNETIQQDQDLEQLFSDYVAICNRALAENQDKFWYRQAKRLNQALWGGASFRSIVYGDHPADVRAEFVIHFDPGEQALKVLPPGDHEVAFSWSAPVSYLRDVVLERPQWYIEHPVMLDWSWLVERIRDEAARVDTRSVTVGFMMGAAAGILAAAALARTRTERRD